MDESRRPPSVLGVMVWLVSDRLVALHTDAVRGRFDSSHILSSLIRPLPWADF